MRPIPTGLVIEPKTSGIHRSKMVSSKITENLEIFNIISE
jgi:hypothetical protein